METSSPLFDLVWPTMPGTGWLTRAEASLLWDYATKVPLSGTILEVGSYHGRGTCLLASTGRRVIAVDPFAGFDSADPDGGLAYAGLVRNLTERGLRDRVTICRCRVEDWPAVPVDMAYLDGDHTYAGTHKQIDVALSSLLTKSTLCRAKIVAVHDVNDSGDGAEIKRACIERLGPWAVRVERLAVWNV